MHRLILLALLSATVTTSAQAPDSVFLEDFTWDEVRTMIAQGTTTVVIPTGGTEQNGPHMALGKHNVRVRYLADRVARQLGHALVAPVMAYVPEGAIDPPSGHMRFAGTITLPDPVFQQVLEYAARSLRVHGFRDIVLIGDSGGNQTGQTVVAATLNAEWAASPVRVHAIPDFYRGDQAGDFALLYARGFRPDETGNHADLVDTSKMLAIAPSMVRMPKAAAGTAENGIVGDPRRANADVGRLLLDRIVARTVPLIQAAIAKR